MLTPAQCRAGRALLDWSQKKLGDKAGGVVFHAISHFERGEHKRWTEENIRGMQTALEDAGIEFLDDNGVRIVKR